MIACSFIFILLVYCKFVYIQGRVKIIFDDRRGADFNRFAVAAVIA